MSERDENERGLSQTDEKVPKREDAKTLHGTTRRTRQGRYCSRRPCMSQTKRQTNASPTISSMRCLISGVIFCTMSIAFIFS